MNKIIYSKTREDKLQLICRESEEFAKLHRDCMDMILKDELREAQIEVGAYVMRLATEHENMNPEVELFSHEEILNVAKSISGTFKEQFLEFREELSKYR